MGKFIGETAGFAMLILIWLLFLMMLQEFKIIDKKYIVLVRKISLHIIAVGLGYLALGSFFYNISVGEAGVFQYDTIWGYGNYAYMMNQVEHGMGEGLLNRLYLGISHVAGRLFFGQYISALIYVSFMFSIVYGLCVYFLIYELCCKGIANKIFPFFFLSPFSYRLFLPMPISMICSIIAFFLWIMIWFYKKKKGIHFFGKIVKNGWIYNSLLCACVCGNVMLFYAEMVLRQ